MDEVITDRILLMLLPMQGRRPTMDDSTEIYAPPEAPVPDGGNPEG